MGTPVIPCVSNIKYCLLSVECFHAWIQDSVVQDEDQEQDSDAQNQDQDEAQDQIKRDTAIV